MAVLPNIFEYLDYRNYLQDCFTALQQENPKFSFRAFGRAANFTSPNYLQLVLKGQRNLNEVHASSAAKVLDLSSESTEFLLWMVRFDTSRLHKDKNFWYQKLLSKRIYPDTMQLEKKQFQYFSEWYHPVVRELACHSEFTGEPRWIVKRIFPRITVFQVEKSLNILQELELIQKAEDNTWFRPQKSITTSLQAPSPLIAEFHRSMIKLAGEAIENFDSSERQILAVTAALSPNKVEEIQEKLANFWREILATTEESDESDEVYEFNLQFFPLTRKSRRES